MPVYINEAERVFDEKGCFGFVVGFRSCGFSFRAEFERLAFHILDLVHLPLII